MMGVDIHSNVSCSLRPDVRVLYNPLKSMQQFFVEMKLDIE